MSETAGHTEHRTFSPPEQLAGHANVGAGIYDEAASDRIAFW